MESACQVKHLFQSKKKRSNSYSKLTLLAFTESLNRISLSDKVMN